MPDVLIWAFVVLFALIPLIGLIALWPIYLYNIAWRVFSQKKPLVPVYVFSSPNAINGYTLYVRDTGWKVSLYGLICLCHGLAIHMFTLSFFINSCGDCTATLFQQITGWTMLVTGAPLAVSKGWVPSARAEAIHRLSNGDELLFWSGVLRHLKKLTSRRPNQIRQKSPR